MTTSQSKQKYNDKLQLVQADSSQIEDEDKVEIQYKKPSKSFRFYIIVAFLAIVVIGLLAFFLLSPKVASNQTTNLHQNNLPNQGPLGQDHNKDKSEFLPKLETPDSNKPTPPQQSTSTPEEALCKARNWPVFPKSPTRRKIYDLFMIRDELDSLELRLGQMWNEVDYFIIMESPVTFAGAAKSLTLLENWDMFKRFHSKIIRHTLQIEGQHFDTPWKREDFQRNAMYDQVVPFLTGEQKIEMGDVILVSDVDELIRNEVLQTLRACEFPQKLVLGSQFFYYGYLFLHQGEEWYHPEATYYNGTNTIRPAELRVERWNTKAARYHNAGWHCSFCFPKLDDIVGKLQTFSHQEFNNPEFTTRSKILYRVVNGLDLFKDPNTVYKRIDNKDIPEYVKENSEKFKYLLERPAPTGNFIDFREEDAVLLK